METATAQERTELQRMIVEIDRKMAEEIGNSRIPRLNAKDHSFPWAIWGLTALCFAWWFLGPMFLQQLDPKYFKLGFFIGLLGVAIGVLKTIIWAWRNTTSKLRRKPVSAEEESQRLRELRAERRRLMERLDKIKDLEK